MSTAYYRTDLYQPHLSEVRRKCIPVSNFNFVRVSLSSLIMGFRYRSQTSSVQLWRRFILIQLTMPSRVESPIARSNPIRHSFRFRRSKMSKKIFRIQTAKTRSWKLRFLSILPSLIFSKSRAVMSWIYFLHKWNIITKLWVWAGLGAWLTYSLTGLCSSFSV